MNRKALIKALIHHHHRTTWRWPMMRNEKALQQLRSKIAERDQYK
jgi:hypothetical protein